MTEPSLVQLATQAYLYAFPLVFNLDHVNQYVSTGVGGNPAAAFNTFSHARTLTTPADTFVTINNDTVFSMAQLDLSAGPVALEVPDAAGRYYVLQFVDAWTNNFAYVGRRATGTAPGSYLLIPPGWSGTPPSGTTLIRFPTTIASIVGRWVVGGAEDLPVVHALQDATRLTAAQAAARPNGLPPVPGGLSEALTFFEKYRLWSQAFPPATRDLQTQSSFAPLGLTGTRPVTDLADDVIAALATGYDAGKAALAESLRGGHVEVVNGWMQTFHVFDYNLDFFEVGTVDDPLWKLDDDPERYVMRAGAALGGLWGNHGYEAIYIATYTDGDGQLLEGSNTYVLRLTPPPPVEAFWSLTMYDVPNYFLVDNPISRYSLGDRTPGLVRDGDGGVTITMSHTEPSDADARANWLPAPAGPFRPILRMYTPSTDVIEGTYRVPPVQRV